MKFLIKHPSPVVEALRARIRRHGYQWTADDLNISVSYLEKLADGRKPMSNQVGVKLGFKKIVTWEPLETCAPRAPISQTRLVQ